MAPPAAIPPPLAPSVEEAYRRKCVQLKQRIVEVEESNSAAVTRLSRMHRGIEKLRLERAFLLEQLAKRTSTNVEDSEGSPSPPQTPQEKPLRTKRGHRKPSFLQTVDQNRGMSAFPANANAALSLSPSSEVFSHSTATKSQPGQPPRSSSHVPRTNGAQIPDLSPSQEVSRLPQNPFELYAYENRDDLLSRHRQEIAEGLYDVDRELALSWQAMGVAEQSSYQERLAKDDVGDTVRRRLDEDVEMDDDKDLREEDD